MAKSRTVSPAAVRAVACDLFATRGYRGTSMKDIAEVLGVSAPSLYNHTPSKQELLVQIMTTAMERAHAVLDDALRGVDEVPDQLRAATEGLVLDFLQHPSEITVCNTEIRALEDPHRAAIVGMRDHYARRIRAIVEQGCEAGAFHSQEPRVATYAVLEMGNNAKAWFNARGEYSADTVAKLYGDFALRVVGWTGDTASRRRRR